MEENLHYVGTIPDIAYYGASQTSESERSDFIAWYEGQKAAVFENICVLESYCQDNFTVLRQACQVFRREFLQVGNIELIQESITIESACNKELSKRFLKPYTIGIISAGVHRRSQV
jgi:hypothetical protein